MRNSPWYQKRWGTHALNVDQNDKYRNKDVSNVCYNAENLGERRAVIIAYHNAVGDDIGQQHDSRCMQDQPWSNEEGNRTEAKTSKEVHKEEHLANGLIIANEGKYHREDFAEQQKDQYRQHACEICKDVENHNARQQYIYNRADQANDHAEITRFFVIASQIKQVCGANISVSDKQNKGENGKRNGKFGRAEKPDQRNGRGSKEQRQCATGLSFVNAD